MIVADDGGDAAQVALKEVLEEGPPMHFGLTEGNTHYSKTAPKLANWMEENLPQGFTVFTLPAAHQQRMRTSNALERVNQELKPAPAWPASSPMNPPSCA